jgi:hypothetical protein
MEDKSQSEIIIELARQANERIGGQGRIELQIALA